MSAPRARLLFAGSPEFALPTLERLLAGSHEVIAVLTQPDRPAGRGRRLTASPVKERALAHGLPVLQPPTLREEPVQQQLRALAPDLMVVVAYGLLLPPTVLSLPRRGCVNVHASLLPRWRGASPIQAALLAGDPETGVSIMALDRGLDTGPVFTMRRIPVAAGDTAATLSARLAELGAAALADVLDGILTGSLAPEPQPAAGATHAGRINKSAALIDWRRPAVEIDRQVRAYNPWPVAETRLAGQQLRCWAARPLPAIPGDGEPGLVLAAGTEGIDVQTGGGVLRLDAVQLAGRPVTTAADFVRGRQLAGVRLGA